MIPIQAGIMDFSFRVKNFLSLSGNYQTDGYFLDGEPHTNIRRGPKHSMNFSKLSQGSLVVLAKGREEDRSTHILRVGDK